MNDIREYSPIEVKSRNKSINATVLISMAGCLITLIISWFYYQDVHFDDDFYKHYLMAKFAWSHHSLFIDIWGRPIVTTLFAFVASFGIISTKLLIIILTMLCSFLTFKTAQLLNLKYAEYIIPFVVCQPCFFISAKPITEIVFALLLIICLIYFLRKKYLISAIICSFLPMARPEGFFVLIFWFILLIYKRKYKILPLLGIGIVIWNLLGYFQSSDVLWFYHNFPWLGKLGFYGSGTIFYYVLLFPFISGILLPFFLIGLVYLIVKRNFLFPGIFIYFFILHTILWKYGLFRSAGYARYFVCVAPIIAIIALYGYGLIDKLLKLKKSVIIVFIVLFIISSPLVSSVIQPSQLASEHMLIKAAYQYYKQNQFYDRPLICASDYFYYLAGYDCFNKEQFPSPCFENVKKYARKSVIIWDSKFFAKEYNVSSQTIYELGYKKVASFNTENPAYSVIIFISQ